MPEELDATAPLIELTGVSKAYAEGEGLRQVLRAVSLRVHAGEFVVLLGRSGSGKTTLLNLIAGLDAPSAGMIRIERQDLATLDDDARTLLRRARIGFVFQTFGLLPTLTALENVALPRELGGGELDEALARARAMLVRVGLGERLHDFPDRLSGGEQQRVAIARALVHEPALILADEPTGNLDLETGKEIVALLEELVRAHGVTLLMVTHSAEVAGRADRILTIEKGRLVEHVSPVAARP